MRILRAMWNLLVACAVLGACNAAPAATTSDPPSAPAGDVTTYRGDAARTGVMTGPGPSGSPHLVWQFQAAAAFESSPSVVGTSAFVISRDGVVYSIDVDTGALQWTVPLGARAGSATPLAVDGLVVVGDQAGVVHALDPNSGAARWTTPTDGAIGGAAVAVGHVIVTATESGSAFALDAETGAVIWKTSLPAAVSRSVTASADTVFLGAGGTLVALRLSDGAILWQSTVSTSGACGTPTVAGGLLYDSTGLDGSDDSAKGVVAVDASTGALRWRHASPTLDQVYTPAVGGGRAFVVSEDGTVTALDAATGGVIWMTPTGAPNEALAALVDGIVYVATNGRTLVALDAGSGALRWQAPIVGVPYAPVVTHGLVLVGTGTGAIFAIGGTSR